MYVYMYMYIDIKAVDCQFQEARNSEGTRVLAASFCSQQAAGALDLHYEADSKGGCRSSLLKGLSPNAKVEEECNRLAGLRNKLRDRLRVERCRGAAQT